MRGGVLVRGRDREHHVLAQARSRSCSPIGSRDRPSPGAEKPAGITIAGSPARFAPIVNTSERYIASGSAVLSPKRNPGTGDAGEAITSHRSNAAS
jgi:hypothetical protein